MKKKKNPTRINKSLHFQDNKKTTQKRIMNSQASTRPAAGLQSRRRKRRELELARSSAGDHAPSPSKCEILDHAKPPRRWNEYKLDCDPSKEGCCVMRERESGRKRSEKQG